MRFGSASVLSLLFVWGCVGGGPVFDRAAVCPDGATVVGPEDSVQQVVDDSPAGDTICLLPGRYLETLTLPPTELRLLGAAGWERTVVDAGRRGPVVFAAGGAGSLTLEGLTITGGLAAGGAGLSVGARDLFVIDTRITDNEAVGDNVFGAAVISVGDTVVMERVRLDNNRATSGSTPIASSRSVSGVGAWFASAVSLRDVVVANNVVTPGSTFDRAFGGGIYVSTGLVDGERVAMFGNRLDARDLSAGGGIYAESDDVVLRESMLVDNVAVAERAAGGGAWLRRGHLEDLVFARNTTTGECLGIGGALAVADGTGSTELQTTVERVSFLSNNAVGDVARGGAVFAGDVRMCADAGSSGSTTGGLSLQNVVAADNRVSGALAQGSALFSERNTTVVQASLVANHSEDRATAAAWFTRHPTVQVVVSNSIVADNGRGIEVSGIGIDPIIRFTAFSNDRDQDVFGIADVLGVLGNAKVAPAFVSRSGDPETWDMRLASGSGLVDAGDPDLSDADGSTSDPGAFGGPDADRWRALSLPQLIPD